MFDCDTNLKFWKQLAQPVGLNKLIAPRLNQLKKDE